MSQLVQFTKEEVFEYHRKNRGKISLNLKTPLRDKKELSLAYTPGVGEICKAIEKNKNEIYKYTNVENTVAVISDGTAVLGFGDIGPHAAMPVMEGKCVLFKALAGVDAIPICLGTKIPEKIIDIVKSLEPTFSGINLEDISAPNCFTIENRLKNEMNIPIFHDDQHGTAVVLFGGLINALKFVNKKIEDIKIVINGAGAAGCAIAKMLLESCAKDVILCDREGIIYKGRKSGMNPFKDDIANVTNKENISGSLKDAIKSSDVFIGVSVANVVTPQMIESMNTDSIVFALANPTPEIMPDIAKKAGAKIVGTGRSDFPNQVNNVMGFPGIFRGTLDVRAKEINDDMKLAAARAISEVIQYEELHEEYIISSPLNPKIVPSVAFSVAKSAIKTNVARIRLSDEELREKIKKNITV